MIDFAFRHVEAFGNDQEVMNERIHVRLHCFTVRQNNLWSISFNRTGLNTRKRLHDYLVRLLHLADADHVSRPDIAVLLYADLKIILLITCIRIGATNIYVDSASAQARPGQSPINRIFADDLTNVLRSLPDISTAS